MTQDNAHEAGLGVTFEDLRTAIGDSVIRQIQAQKIQEALAQRVAELETAIGETKAVKAEAAALKAANDAAGRQINDLNAALQATRTEAKEARKDLASERQRYSDLEKRNATLESELGAMRTSRDATAAERDALGERVVLLAAELEATKKTPQKRR